MIEKYGAKTAFLIIGRILLTFFGIVSVEAAGISIPPVLIAGVIIYTVYTTFLTVQGWTKFLFWLKKRKEKKNTRNIQRKLSRTVSKDKVSVNAPETINPTTRPNNGGK